MQVSFDNERQKRLAKVLANDSSFASAIFLGVLGYYGPEILQWDPATILQELEEDFGVKMPQGCYDRLMAAITVATTDMFEKDLPTFIHLCNAISGSPITEEFDPASVLEMTWAITEMNLMDLEPGEDKEFSDDIRYYMAEMCKEEGLLNPPVAIARLTADLVGSVPSDFTNDDPAMAQGMWYSQQTRSIDIELTVQSNVWKLYQQLKELFPEERMQKKLTEMQQRTAVSIEALRKQEADLAVG